ncbi:hypothetical protein L2E82_09939 [Cichorium intybus]|uniref:Uncharacterized protein n=1 Tax=Cichorium intybus TaxID=13427 RepID=A0ACB9GAJ6_CICIN|nr:hypothetical protein L2E82_09939 [Cichorium intybus]
MMKSMATVVTEKARSWDEGVSSHFSTTPLSDIFKGKNVVIFRLPGTAGVALAGLLGTVRAQGQPLSEFVNQKIAVVGAGSNSMSEPRKDGHEQYPPPPPHKYGCTLVPGYAVAAEGRHVREGRLPCCGIGIGWFLFTVGFFFAIIPWYIGAFILLCAGYDDREKPGYVACVIAMQQEIKDLTNECDVPRTRLEEILRAAGIGQILLPWNESPPLRTASWDGHLTSGTSFNAPIDTYHKHELNIANEDVCFFNRI